MLRQYWRIMFRHRWIVLGVVGGFLLLAIVVSLLMQRLYTAEARLEIAREEAKIVDIAGAEEDRSSAAASAEFYQTQYELLQSRSLAESVVRDLRLSENFTFLAEGDADAAGGFKAVPRKDRFEEAVKLIDEGLEIAPVRNSSIVDVRFTDPAPALAAQITNSVVENYIENNLERRFERTKYAREFLERQLEETRQKLEQSERQATEYARRQNLIQVGGDGEDGAMRASQMLTTLDLQQLSEQLAIARAQRVRAEADFRAATGGAAATSSLSNQAVNMMRQSRAELRAELSKLESDFGPEFPRVVALKAQVAELDQQIAREEDRVRSSVRKDLEEKYRQALRNERSLQSRVNALKGNVLDEQQRSIAFNIIQRDVDTNRELYQALLQRYKEIGIAGGVGTNNVSIVDPARVPKHPSSPNLPLNLALGLVMGLIVGGASAFVAEQLADNVILPGEFRQKLGVPLLGTTPRLASDNIMGELSEDRSEISEAYFSTMTSIQFANERGTPATLLVTSSLPNEGKSTSAFALAKSLASVGRRVLLIDADMRNPSLHRLLGRTLGPGLSEILAARADINDYLSASDVEGLTVLLAGAIPSNPAELLASGHLEKILSGSLNHFDHVVIDGPPVIGLADAPQLARLVEGTVLVMEAGRTRVTQARQALERLRAVRANILGTILAKFDAKAEGYGYGYGYSYRYGANDDEQRPAIEG
nr:polysaccharide biosynthesis tyrosine autokinase [Sphingomicrobium lutaoense]